MILVLELAMKEKSIFLKDFIGKIKPVLEKLVELDLDFQLQVLLWKVMVEL